MELAAGVDQFLQNYMGQKLKSFRVCLCYRDDIACLVDNWTLKLCAKMDVEEFVLGFKCRSESGDLYKFPVPLLPVDKASHLKHLCLNQCLLKPPPELNQFHSRPEGITIVQHFYTHSCTLKRLPPMPEVGRPNHQNSHLKQVKTSRLCSNRPNEIALAANLLNNSAALELMILITTDNNHSFVGKNATCTKTFSISGHLILPNPRRKKCTICSRTRGLILWQKQ